jgi:hypothetical protein
VAHFLLSAKRTLSLHPSCGCFCKILWELVVFSYYRNIQFVNNSVQLSATFVMTCFPVFLKFVFVLCPHHGPPNGMNRPQQHKKFGQCWTSCQKNIFNQVKVMIDIGSRVLLNYPNPNLPWDIALHTSHYQL